MIPLSRYNLTEIEQLVVTLLLGLPQPMRMRITQELVLCQHGLTYVCFGRDESAIYVAECENERVRMTIELMRSGTIGAAVALFLLVACFLVRDATSRTVAAAGVLFCAGAAARAILVEPEFSIWSGPVRPLLMVLCLGHAAALLAFSRALFDDEARIDQRDVGLWMALVAAGLFVFGVGDARPVQAGLRTIFAGAEILAAMAALAVAWRGVADDLVERRRGTRFAFVLLGSLHVMVLGATEVALSIAPTAGWIGLLNTSGLVVVAAGLAYAVGGFRDEGTFATGSGRRRAGPGGPVLRTMSHEQRPVIGFDSAEIRLFETLNRIMDCDRIYRDEGLTIRSLASRLNVSERSLRGMINRCLGYRNFNAYLNARRLCEVKAALVDPEQAEVPISTIALDAGFGSLGQFNRTFRAEEGMTPSEYREQFMIAAEPHWPTAISG